MGFARQEYWSGVPLPSLRVLLLEVINYTKHYTWGRGFAWLSIVFSKHPKKGFPLLGFGCFSLIYWCITSYPKLMSWKMTVCFHTSGSAGKESDCNVGLRAGFDHWVGKILRRERLSTPGLWPGEFHELYSPCGHRSWTWLSDFHFSHLTYLRARNLGRAEWSFCSVWSR